VVFSAGWTSPTEQGDNVKQPPADGNGSTGATERPHGTRFRGELELGGKTATGIRVPAEVVTSLGPSRRPAVRVTINGHTYRTSVASTGGGFMLPVSAEQREAAGVAAGDVLDVDIELDSEPREVTVPSDFTDALDRDARPGGSSTACPTPTSGGTYCGSREPRRRRPGRDASPKRSPCCARGGSRADQKVGSVNHTLCAVGCFGW
jgi:hypothetical protein